MDANVLPSRAYKNSEKHLPSFVALHDELKAAGAEVIACVSGNSLPALVVELLTVFFWAVVRSRSPSSIQRARSLVHDSHVGVSRHFTFIQLTFCTPWIFVCWLALVAVQSTTLWSCVSGDLRKR